MQRRAAGVIGAVGILLALLAASASAAPTHTLKTFEARSEADSAAFDFELRRNLDSSSVGRCQRTAPRRVICAATVRGESDRATTTCKLRISVRAVFRAYYWDTVAAVAQQRCRSEEKPLLSYSDARAAIQADADRFAGRATTLTYISRRDDQTFAGTAQWERPRVPPNEFIPTEICSVELVARLDQTISVTTEGFRCF